MDKLDKTLVVSDLMHIYSNRIIQKHISSFLDIKLTKINKWVWADITGYECVSLYILIYGSPLE